MARMIKRFFVLFAVVFLFNTAAQAQKPVYHPCFLMDSVDKHLDFIRINAARIFVDSFDCRQTLLDSIAIKYVRTKNDKYLDVLSAVKQNPRAKVDELYTDIIKRLIEDDFSGFINQLYIGRGKYLPLEKELITTLNMIVDSRPLRQKYMGRLNVEIEKAKDAKDKYRQLYLEKLKLKIEEEKL
jgi:hypothetical protein